MSDMPICRAAQIRLLGYNVSGRKDLEWTAHGQNLDKKCLIKNVQKGTKYFTCNGHHSHKHHDINPIYSRRFTTNIHFDSRDLFTEREAGGTTVPPVVSQPPPARQGPIGLALFYKAASRLVDGWGPTMRVTGQMAPHGNYEGNSSANLCSPAHLLTMA